MEKLYIDLIDEKNINTVLELLEKLRNHSEESYVHSLDVAEKAVLLAEAFGVHDQDLKKLYTASLLHDIGKLYIDPDLLHKTNVTSKERDFIRKEHIKGTKEILSGHFDEEVVKLATHHHERLNSSGYPEHLNAKKLDLLDRILQVADVTSALSMKRSYQEAQEPAQIIEILENLVRRSELDKKCVKTIEEVYLIPLKNLKQPENG